MNRKEYLVDNIFIKYFLVIYYLYVMSVNVIFPKGGIAAIFVNGLILFFLVYASVVRNRYNNKFTIIYFYILLQLMLIILQSSNLIYSVTNLIKYSIGLLCLPLGFNILSSVKKLKNFQKTGLVFLILYLVNIVLANIFHFGDYYGYKIENGLEIGNVFTDGLYANVYVITSIFFLLLLFPTHKKMILSITAICAVLVIVNMKRTAILVLLVGPVMYLFFYFAVNGKIKSRLASMHLKYMILFMTFALLVLPFFYNEIQMRLDAREKHFQESAEDITNEGRIAEFIYIYDEILYSDNFLTLLFGKETLNYVGTYANGIFGNRQIHGDYSKILHGTGILGVLVWGAIHLFLIVWIVRLKNSIPCKTGIMSSILYPLYFSFFIIYLLSMMSGVRECVLPSSYFYTSVGGILRYFYNRKWYTKNFINENINRCKI